MTEISANISMDSDKYWAFISYSHKDSQWSEWLHRSLEKYKVPKSIVGRTTRSGFVPKRLRPIFRDRDEFPTSGELGEAIHVALRQSKYLIVICSPHSARSIWVDKEVRYFKSLGRQHNVICLIIDGTPESSPDITQIGSEAFVSSLTHLVNEKGELLDNAVEPIAADVRPGQDRKSIALLRILAGLLGVDFDELRQREKVKRRWFVTKVAVWSLFGAVIFSGAAVGSALLVALTAVTVSRGQSMVEHDDSVVAHSVCNLLRSVKSDMSNLALATIGEETNKNIQKIKRDAIDGLMLCRERSIIMDTYDEIQN